MTAQGKQHWLAKCYCAGAIFGYFCAFCHIEGDCYQNKERNIILYLMNMLITQCVWNENRKLWIYQHISDICNNNLNGWVQCFQRGLGGPVLSVGLNLEFGDGLFEMHHRILCTVYLPMLSNWHWMIHHRDNSIFSC